LDDGSVVMIPGKPNPRRQPYKAYGAAKQLWAAKDEEVLIEGPAGTGKTRGALEKLHFMAMKYRGARVLIVRKTRESMNQTILVTFEQQVVPLGHPLTHGIQRRMRSEYQYINGSIMAVGGMDNPGKIMSSEYDAIGVFEATELTEEDWEMLTSRLGRCSAIPYSQIMGDCNPRAPSHWLNKRCNKGTTRRLLSRHRDNPIFFDMEKEQFTPKGEAYLKRLGRMTGVRRERFLNGKWAANEGMVYENWDENAHVIDKMPKGWESWRKLRAIDFGYNNPFVCLWAAIDPDNDIYIYREMYFSHRTVSQHALGIIDQDTKKVLNAGIVHYSLGEDYETTLTDHDREDRATLEAAGIPSAPAYKDISTGVDAVKDRLEPTMHGDGKKRPRIYFLRDALVERDEDLIEASLPFCTVQEFDGYIYQPVKEGKAIKEEPVDKDNHGMDTVRYIVAYVDDLAGSIISVSAEAPEVVTHITASSKNFGF
jgi:phage terminase large subunit